MKKIKSVDQYILSFPEPIQKKLNEIRSIITKALPEAEEIISYNMPAYKLNSVAVYFAGYKNHVGFYPTSSGIKNFEDQFEKYKWSKGAVQFPIDKPIPVKLVTAICKFRKKETENPPKKKTTSKK